jgi:hypothetical protein
MMAAMRVLIPVPDRDFDATEVAVPWRLWELCLGALAGRCLSVCPPISRHADGAAPDELGRGSRTANPVAAAGGTLRDGAKDLCVRRAIREKADLPADKT